MAAPEAQGAWDDYGRALGDWKALDREQAETVKALPSRSRPKRGRRGRRSRLAPVAAPDDFGQGVLMARPPRRRVDVGPRTHIHREPEGWSVQVTRRGETVKDYFGDAVWGGRRWSLLAVQHFRDRLLQRIEPDTRIRRRIPRGHRSKTGRRGGEPGASRSGRPRLRAVRRALAGPGKGVSSDAASRSNATGRSGLWRSPSRPASLASRRVMRSSSPVNARKRHGGFEKRCRYLVR